MASSWMLCRVAFVSLFAHDDDDDDDDDEGDGDNDVGSDIFFILPDR
jgi:hypothetical protein